jgi:hypothetical protein
VKSNDIITVNLPLPQVEETLVRNTFTFVSNQMAKALSNLMEVRNAARRSGAVKYEATLNRYIRTIDEINRAIDDQRSVWAAALKSKQSRTVQLPNYPATPLSSYAKSNRLRYQKNVTMRVLSPKVRAMLDQIGQRFAMLRNEFMANTTKQFLREVSTVTTQNALKRLENRAWVNGVDANAIAKAVSKRRTQLATTPSIQTISPVQRSNVMNAFRRIRSTKIVRGLVSSRPSWTMT